MRLHPAPHPFEVLAQPLVAKANAGVWVGLRLRGPDEWFERFELVDEAGERFALTVCIGEGVIEEKGSAH